MDADPAGEFHAGQYYYAIRGTAGTPDLATDGGDIVLDGLALDQIVNIYNDWQRLNTVVSGRDKCKAANDARCKTEKRVA